DRKRGDVTRVREDVDAECGRVAAVALRPDAEAVGADEQLLLERLERRVGIRGAELAEQCLLAEDGGFFERPPPAHPDDHPPAPRRRRREQGGGRHPAPPSSPTRGPSP